jgi:O-antigen/teichoic acid export membrane protein
MTAVPLSRLLTAVPLSRLLRMTRDPKAKILVSSAIGLLLVFVTSIARIPLIIHSLGTAGYGLLLAVTALTPWMMLVIGGVTNVARVDIAEALGAAGEQSAWATLEDHRRRAYRVSAWVGTISILVAVAVPWNSLLLSKSGMHMATWDVPLGIAVSGVMVALSAPGSVYEGLLQANRRVAITAILPGVAAILSLTLTALAAALSAPFVVFVMASGAATCAPYWFAHILGLPHRARMRRRLHGTSVTAPFRTGNTKDLVIMTGAAAPPLFSTGWDPVVLGAAAGPQAVAAYGLATRLATLVTIVPGALYPHFWAEYARLRAAGEREALRARLRRDIIVVVALTSVLGALYVGIGPIVGTILGSHGVSQPRSLYAAFAVFGVLAALQTVLLPVLGGRSSAWLIATLVFAFILPNVALSYALSLRVGAVGPVLASIFFSVLLLSIAWVRIRRRPELLVDTSEVPGRRSLQNATPPTNAISPAMAALIFPRPPTRIYHQAAARRVESAAVETATSAVGGSPYAEVVTRVWRRAAWAGAAAYFVGSPSLTIVANGSTIRGAILASFPLVASVWCFMGVQKPKWRGGRELMVPAAFAAVVVWQFLSAYFNLGPGYIMHAVPAVTLLMLGLRVRAVQYELPVAELRRCLAALLGPLVTILLLGLVLQMLGKIPSDFPSAFPLSVHGARLQGLAIHPVGDGLLAGLTLLLALAARGDRVRLALYRSVTVAILILTDARTAWVGTLAAVVLMWLLEPQRSTWRRLFPILVTMMALPAIASFVLIQRSGSSNVLSGRNTIWQNTLPLLRQLNVFGYGPGAIARLFPDVGGLGSAVYQAQNQWLNDAINFGWVGLLLLAVLCLSISLAGPLYHRRMLLFPMLIYILVVSFSETPLDIWDSIVQAFPLFLIFIVTSRGRNPLIETADPPTGAKEEVFL